MTAPQVVPSPTPQTPTAAPGVAPVDLTRRPYLQQCAADSVTVVWDTDVPANSEVEYRAATGESFTVVDSKRVPHHVVRLTGLRPSTEYQYSIASAGRILARASFRSPPAPGQPFTFVVFGDSGNASEGQLRVAEQLAANQPDLLLHAGDLVYTIGAAEDYQSKFFDPYADILQSACIYPTLGNHDYITDDGQPYLDVFHLPANNPRGTERYYSFDYGDAHFVALDSNIDRRFDEFQSPAGQEMLAWLDADLAASDALWKVVVIHHPPYSSSPKHGSESRIRYDLGPIFERHGVDLVFAGHNHVYERTRPIDDFEEGDHGVVYVTTGGGGGSLDVTGNQDFTAYTASTRHFVRVSVSGDTLALEAVGADGSAFDSYTVSANDRPAGQPSLSTFTTAPDIVICPADHGDNEACEYEATGVNDQALLQSIADDCPRIGCTLILESGTFVFSAPQPQDRLTLYSNMRLEFREGAQIDFTGADADRYAIDINGETAFPIRNVYVGGPGIITVHNQSDHGLRVRGDATEVTVGDGLRIRHANPSVSIDEGIQVAGTVDVRGITIRDITIEGFGVAGGDAAAIELAGTTRNSTIDGLTATGNRHAVSLRGSVEPAESVLLGRRRNNVSLDEATGGNLDTTGTAALSENDQIMIGYSGRFAAAYFELDALNRTAAVIRASVSNENGRWTDVAILRDGTSANGVPFAQSGEIEFEIPEGEAWATERLDSRRRYWLRLTVSNALDPIDIRAIGIYTIPTGNTVSNLVSLDSITDSIVVLSARYNTIADAVIESANGNAILSVGITTGLARGNRYENVSIDTAAGSGYSFTDSPETQVTGGSVRGTNTGILQIGPANENSYFGDGLTIESSAGNGIVVTSGGTVIDGAIVRGNGIAANTTASERAGVRLASGTGVTVRNSRIVDDSDNPTQAYGIFVMPQAIGAILEGNAIEGNAVGQIRDDGADTLIAGNVP